MTNVLFVLTIYSGVLAGPIRCVAAAPDHHQVATHVAMAKSGLFSVTWLDSLSLSSDEFTNELFILYFNKDGDPLGIPYKVRKIKPASELSKPSLDMDTSGNAILLWLDYIPEPPDFPVYLRFQVFKPNGTPRDTAKTLIFPGVSKGKPVSLNNKGEFAVAASVSSEYGYPGTGICIRKFNLNGTPLDTFFYAHAFLDSLPLSDTTGTNEPQVSLNDKSDLVVTWFRGEKTAHTQPCYQVFDADDNPVNWEPFGHRLDAGDSRAGVYISHPHWTNNDRFVVFWTDYTRPGPSGATSLLGRVFSDLGQTLHDICTVSWGDSLQVMVTGTLDPFSMDISPSGKFAYTHERMYTFLDSITDPHQWKTHSWTHDAGFLGEIVGNEPIRKTSLFEYTPAWDPDTIWCADHFGDFPLLQQPAVACNDDRIVWVYSRLNSDTVFEAYALVTDWNMGVGVQDKPTITTPSNFTLLSPIGSEIVLRYEGMPGGFRAIVYDASGRQVDEIKSNTTSGSIQWGAERGSGVYFIVAEDSKARPSKVILIR